MPISLQTRRERFLLSAKRIKECGFRVFLATNQANTYGYYSDGSNVAYFQENEFRSGTNIAIVNKPHEAPEAKHSSGMHLVIEPNMLPVPPEKLTGDYLKKGFLTYPDYFDREAREAISVMKYIDLRDFLERNNKNNEFSEL